MRTRMNNEARPGDWKVAAAQFITTLWKAHNDGGYVFIGTKDAADHRWQEHAFELPVEIEMLVTFFRKFDRKGFDTYFCANPFETDERKTIFALNTRYACVDVDDAPLGKFEPSPTVSWETSPGRSQAIWAYNRCMPVQHAEQIARDLAYTYGADKNGWSVTKYLRVPFTYNHKPQYDCPEVRILQDCVSAVGSALEPPPFVPASVRTSRKEKRTPSKADFTVTNRLPRGRNHRLRILAKYRSQLRLMPRAMLGHDKLLFHDRSDAIYAIVAGLSEVGATRREIEICIWNCVYFLDKHGQDRRALEAEISRILGKLGATQ